MAAGAGSSGPVREIRIALVCYGGVSLAIYMHGVTRSSIGWSSPRADSTRSGIPSIRGGASTSTGSSCTSGRPRMAENVLA
jgi:hypothetical protein